VVVVDASLAVTCGALLVVGQAVGIIRVDSGDAIATAAAVVAPLALRRVAPFQAAIVVAAGIIATGGRIEAVDLAAFAVLSFSMGDTATSRRRSLVTLTVIVGAVGLWFALNGSAYAIAMGYLVTVPAWLAGDWWRERCARADERAEAERRERDDRVRRAVLDERRRLARELHDVVAHHVGVMVVQTGGARQVLVSSPDRASAAMQTVEATGREALTELRRLLDVLADDQVHEARLAPHPSLSDVEAMVGRLHDAGLSVSLRIEGKPRKLPDGLGVAAYRIIQEALTNAMKHARGAPTSVIVNFGTDSVVLEVIDEGVAAPGPLGPGRGLRGMRERAEALGGSLEAGPRDGRGFAVRAWLPITESIG
jgi:signal transduction histidine kinase